MKTSVCQVLNLLYVGCLIVVRYQAYYGGVVSEFDNGVIGVYVGVYGKYGIKEGAEDVALGCACVEYEGG